MKQELDPKAIRDERLILIVDDEPDIAITYSLLFEHSGFRVITASNGEDALKIANENIPDIVLSDYMMPFMDGAELCRQFKKDPILRDGFFILTSAAMRPAEFVAPYDLFMQKPVSFHKLLQEINRHLE
jgi:CheY-like chemotaxis protein